MYDNRDNFTNRPQDDHRNEDSNRRWRRAEGRYRREAYGEHDGYRPGEDSFEDRSDRYRNQSGHGRGARDEDYGERGGYGRSAGRPDEGGYNQPTYYGSRDYGRSRGADGREDNRPVHHWHSRDSERRAGHPYEGTYGGTGDSSYFTGGQGSWAIGAPQTPSSYYGGGGASRFGADYRPHGYTGHDDDGHRGIWDRATDEVASWFGDDDAARRREQDHRGAGPKDYTRSDERIREDANDRLTEDWRIDASHVTVSVENGEITLNGTVANRRAKRRAEDVVDDISGVKHVQNNLRVQAASGTAYSGGDRAASQASTAEGGTVSTARSDTSRQTDKA